MDKIDYINALASTPLGDVIEVNAVRRLWARRLMHQCLQLRAQQDDLARQERLRLFSTMAVDQDIVPPTLNLLDPEPKLDGFDLVPLEAKTPCS